MKRITLPLYVLAGGIATVILLAAWSVHESHQRDAQIEAARVERVQQINRVNREQCASLRNLYSIIRQTVQASDMNIDTLDYYRAHPVEARLVHEQNRKTLERFREPPCPDDVNVK